MSKMDWRRARQHQDTFASAENAIRAGIRADHDAWLKAQRAANKLTPAQQVLKKTGPYKPGTYQDRDGVWIVVGADCPWNTTPGTRQVHHFRNQTEARKAGF